MRVPGGSAASLDAFVAAREAAGHPERGTVYMSDQSHTAFLRAAIIAGIRRECIRKIPADRHFRLDLNAHKWLFQPYEAGCLLVKDLKTLEKAFGVHHDVLQDTIWGADHPNFSDRGLQLSRSFRALKVWMSIQTFGMAAFRRAVANGMELAARAEDYVRASPVLEVVNAASLGIVCFRVNPEDADLPDATLEELNGKVLAQIFWDDTAFISSTTLHGKFSLRLCIINHNTTWKDVLETLRAIERFGNSALRDRRG